VNLEEQICELLELKILRKTSLQGKEVWITYNAHHREEAIRFDTTLRKGWQIKASIILHVERAPEIVVADTSEPWLNPHGADPVEWFKVCSNNLLLEELLRETGIHNFIVLKGKSLETQVRIAVAPEDNDPKISNKIFKKALKEGHVKRHKAEWKVRKVSSTMLPRGVWREIAEQCAADFFIFVLEAGKPYAIAFKAETGIEPLLIEYHAEKYKNCGRIRLPRLPEGSRVVLIDKFYSGSTLLELKELLKKMNVKVTLVALFPKSRMNLTCTDYIVWWDKLLKTSSVTKFLDDKNWHIHLCNLIGGCGRWDIDILPEMWNASFQIH